jgi:hypothetical protein
MVGARYEILGKRISWFYTIENGEAMQRYIGRMAHKLGPSCIHGAVVFV